jgi:hypothetical protein
MLLVMLVIPSVSIGEMITPLERATGHYPRLPTGESDNDQKPGHRNQLGVGPDSIRAEESHTRQTAHGSIAT